MRFLRYLIAFSTASCGVELTPTYTVSHSYLQDDYYFQNIDPILKPYIDDFAELFDVSTDMIAGARFVVYTDKPHILATCDQGSSGTLTIRVDFQKWQGLTLAQQETVMFHELGHCVLKRDHNDADVMWRGISIPASFMTPSLPESFILEGNRGRYVREMRRWRNANLP